MNLVKEMRERRVPQYLSAYIVGGWGILQFTAFLESRLLFSPQVVNLLTLVLVCLFPGVALLAWRHGRPGHDKWSWIEKIGIPAILLATVILSWAIFHNKDFGAITETVTVETDEGKEIQRSIPKQQYGQEVFINYFENKAGEDDAWLSHGIAMMINYDLIQDPFVVSTFPVYQSSVLRDLGLGAGFDLSLGKKRQLARELNANFFTSGSYEKTESGWLVHLDIYDLESGRKAVSRTFEGSDIVALMDVISRQLRLDIGIPSGHVEQQIDLSVKEILSENPESLRLFSEGLQTALHENDWNGGKERFQSAVDQDDEFALCHFMLYAARLSSGEGESEANQSIRAALSNIYQMPERLQFATKSVYYYNVEKEPDRAMAILEMWIKLYPNDVAAYAQKLRFCMMRNDYDSAISALEHMIEIAPYQHLYWLELAKLYRRQSKYDQAEALYLEYAKLYPTKTESYTGLSSLYRDMGDLHKAKENIEQALLLEPGKASLVVSLAMFERRLGHFDEAKERCEEALSAAETIPDRLSALEGLMNIYATTGQMAEAWSTLDKHLESTLEIMDPSSASLRYGFQVIDFLTPSNAPAIRQRLQSMNADIIELNRRISALGEAFAAIAMDDLEAANTLIETCESFVQQYKYEALRPLIQTAKAKVATKAGDLKQALDWYENALLTSPTKVNWMIGKTELLLELKEFKDAEKQLKRLQELDPGNPWVQLLEAKLEWSQGHQELAKELVSKVRKVLENADPLYPPKMDADKLAVSLGL